uniref:Uncharacterized protein n=1 Tax=Cairina moschata TaxID=8855 RepID=A0A8C3BJ81_CAIMO
PGAGGGAGVGAGAAAEEPVVSLAEVLAENEELEKEARAVLGGSDHERCSYAQVGPAPRTPRHPHSAPPIAPPHGTPTPHNAPDPP